MLGSFKQQCILSLVKRRKGKEGLRHFLSACSTDLVSLGQTNEESRVFCKKSTVFLRMFLILVPSPLAGNSLMNHGLSANKVIQTLFGQQLGLSSLKQEF